MSARPAAVRAAWPTSSPWCSLVCRPTPCWIDRRRRRGRSSLSCLSSWSSSALTLFAYRNIYHHNQKRPLCASFQKFTVERFDHRGLGCRAPVARSCDTCVRHCGPGSEACCHASAQSGVCASSSTPPRVRRAIIDDRVLTSSFAKTRRTYVSTVQAEIPSTAAIVLLV